MTAFISELRASLSGLGLEGQRLLVAVSGGADSVGLLRGLVELRDELQLQFTAAHMDHGLRGEQSRADAEWVSGLCARFEIPCAVGREDLAEFARKEGLGIEESGRRLRYRFLMNEAERAGCEFVAAGHTADDQAETILHHILRGTGLAGLRGMPRRRRLSERVELVRPLLDMRRADLLAYLNQLGQEFREDLSNVDPRFTRNRIRHTLLPLLRAEFNPAVESALRRLGAQAGEVHELLTALASDLLDESLSDAQPTLVRLDCRCLVSAPRVLVRELLRLAWQRQQWPEGGMTFDHWDRTAGLAQRTGDPARTGGEGLTLPGTVHARRRGHLLVLSRPCGK